MIMILLCSAWVVCTVFGIALCRVAARADQRAQVHRLGHLTHVRWDGDRLNRLGAGRESVDPNGTPVSDLSDGRTGFAVVSEGGGRGQLFQ
jgi:hypothetical protein